MAKEKIKFLTTSEMLEYAMEIKPELRCFLDDPKVKEEKKPGLILKIKRTLIEHGLAVQQQKNKENEDEKRNVYKVSEPVAKFVVENILSSYFDRKIEEYRKIEAKTRREKFRNSDQQLSDEQQVLFELFSSCDNDDEHPGEVMEDKIKKLSGYVEKVEKEKIFERIQKLLGDVLKIIEDMRKSENKEYNDMARKLGSPRNHMYRCIKENAGKDGVSIYTELYDDYKELKCCIEETDKMIRDGRADDAEAYGIKRLPAILSKIDKSMEIMRTASKYKHSIQTMSGMMGDYDEYGIHKEIYEYHIKDICWDSEDEWDVAGIPHSYIEDTVYHTMVRALFDKFYNFNGEEFRKDLVGRSRLIIPGDPRRYKDGYQELTDRLEHPVGNYIFPKKEPT